MTCGLNEIGLFSSLLGLMELNLGVKIIEIFSQKAKAIPRKNYITEEEEVEPCLHLWKSLLKL